MWRRWPVGPRESKGYTSALRDDRRLLNLQRQLARLKTAFNLDPGADYAVVGEPRDVGSARALWEQDPYQFQFWDVSLLEAQPQAEQRRGADQGIDGIIYFVDGPRRTPQKVVIQVKGGRVSSPQIRDLKGVVEREKAALGLFISLDVPRQLFLPVWRQLFLPVHLLGLAPLLGCIGAVAGDVKLQDDGVMDHSIDGRGGGHGVGEDVFPLREDQV